MKNKIPFFRLLWLNVTFIYDEFFCEGGVTFIMEKQVN